VFGQLRVELRKVSFMWTFVRPTYCRCLLVNLWVDVCYVNFVYNQRCMYVCVIDGLWPCALLMGCWRVFDQWCENICMISGVWTFAWLNACGRVHGQWCVDACMPICLGLSVCIQQCVDVFVWSMVCGLVYDQRFMDVFMIKCQWTCARPVVWGRVYN